MLQVDSELDRYLTLLRNKIRERGYTQLEVQEVLSWGRSYISQILTRQKNLRVDQVLLILNVIGVEPREFFADLYLPRGAGASPEWPSEPPMDGGEGAQFRRELGRFEALLNGLVRLLAERRVFTSSELGERGDGA